MDRAPARAFAGDEKGPAPPMKLARFAIILLGLATVAWSGAGHAAAEDEEAPTLRLMALNMYHEAGGEGPLGMVAVGWVVLNRVRDPAFPPTVAEVIRDGGEERPCEWGWFCDGRPDTPRRADDWRLALRLAERLLDDPPPDPTRGALWFQESFRAPQPWMRKVRRLATLGNHDFFGR
ncbi:MAG TPA: cell wall hydrolase [Geminicoccaceae bacterium]|nr:cell wall hydrolase [Geminicoccaceae bacterium]